MPNTPPRPRKPRVRKPKVRTRAQIPLTWYFPTSDPQIVRACDFNTHDGEYNLNCRTLPIDEMPKVVLTAMNRIAKVTEVA